MATIRKLNNNVNIVGKNIKKSIENYKSSLSQIYVKKWIY